MRLAIFVSSAPGLEPLLAREVEAIAPARVVTGGVETEGDRTTLARLLIETGLASHVLVRIASFPVRELRELEAHVGRLPWTGWLRKDEPRRVRVTAQRSRLYHTGAIEERVVRAIQQRLGDQPRQDELAAVPIVVRMSDDRCTLSIDAGGAPLHRRGYRLDPHRAPMREDLARALVISSGWDGVRPLLDPMCGSGTLAIEAALIATATAPGIARAFAAERTPLDQGEIAAVRAAARARVQSPAGPIVGRDRDPEAVGAARENAERAVGAGVVDLEIGPLSTAAEAMRARGVIGDVEVITNPPWGGRLGDPERLRPLYGALGSLTRALPGARLTLAAHDRKLAYATGVPLKSALLTDLGGTKVAFMVPEAR
jgi:putative N6-adenine-specific DNA methylase